MSEEKASYRQIFKATSLFGGVQVINIIISIIRSKIIAVLLGPTGMGIAGLLTSTTSLISGFTNLGLGTSAIRNIAIAKESGNVQDVSKVITVLRRLVWITGTLGMLTTILLAPFLSELTFGNTQYTNAFRWLSVSLLFNQLTSGQNVLMQGMRELKSLATANVFGSFFGLLISVPLYFIYSINGIVPAMIVTSVAAMLIEYYFASRIKIDKASVNRQETVVIGKSMVSMGLMLSLSSLITIASSYIVKVYVSREGSVVDVGLYNAGFAIITSYVGLVFTAMSTDFFPRLSGVIHDQTKVNNTINQQADLSILILGPILSAFIVFIHWVVVLLYDVKFIGINTMMQWAALGIFFKAGSWSIAFIFLAKGANKLYFWNELGANIYITLLSIICYQKWGVTGLGLSFLLGYLLYFVQVYILAKRLYNFDFQRSFLKLFILQLSFAGICFFLALVFNSFWSYIFGGGVMLLSCYYSLRELNRRLNIAEIIKRKRSD